MKIIVFSLLIMVSISAFAAEKISSSDQTAPPIYRDETPYPAYSQDRILCPVCLVQEKRSLVYIGDCDVHYSPKIKYYDEDGNPRYRRRDPTICNYFCSRGHKFQRKTYD